MHVFVCGDSLGFSVLKAMHSFFFGVDKTAHYVVCVCANPLVCSL